MRRRGVFPGQAGSQSDLSDSQCLKPRFQRIETDANGLRNAQDAYEKPIDVLLMGDSFTFGYGTNQPDIWSELLAERNVGNVYNMGVYGASPGEQVELLVYLLENNKIHMRNDGNVFFILFQGNDLTDSTPYNHENEITKIDLIKNYMRYIQSHTLLYKLYNIKRILEAKKYGYLTCEVRHLALYGIHL